MPAMPQMRSPAKFSQKNPPLTSISPSQVIWIIHHVGLLNGMILYRYRRPACVASR